MSIIRQGGKAVTALACALLAGNSARAQDGAFLVPPADIRQAVEAPRLPDTRISAPGRFVVLLHRGNPSLGNIATLYESVAGYRIDPLTSSRRNPNPYVGVSVKDFDSGTEHRLRLPDGSYDASTSPNGRHVAVTAISSDGTALILADPRTGATRTLIAAGEGLSSVNDTVCHWEPDSSGLLCYFAPDGRGPKPMRPSVPRGPTIRDTRAETGASRAYQDVIATDYDEELFEYYFVNQLVRVALDGGRRTVGKPGIYPLIRIAPDGRWIRIDRVTKPYSRTLRATQFARDIEVWTAAGQLTATLTTVAAEDSLVRGREGVGPREFLWHPTLPSTLLYAYTPAAGKPAGNDQLRRARAPFTSHETLATFPGRLDGLMVTEAGAILASEVDARTPRTQWWIVEPARNRPLWRIEPGDSSTSDAWALGGRFGAVAQDGDDIFLTGEGVSAALPRPYLDRLSLKTGDRRRVWQSDTDAFEVVYALLNQRGDRLMTHRQSATTPPNLFVRDLAAGSLTPVTTVRDPHPNLTGMHRRVLTYKRDDGVALSGTLFWPRSHVPGTRLPLLVWAYPREFSSAAAAAQIRQSDNRFRAIAGASPLLLVNAGYAVLLEPTMPVVGPRATANDTFSEQVIAAAEAAVEAAVATGVVDGNRVAIGGHSYGGFTAAHLLAHTKLFRAGIARSGPYNRTLTPFGWQNDRRSLWNAKDIYLRMSPLMEADRIKTPLLLIHGEQDETVPVMQSRLFFDAVKGTGGTARYVEVPYEGHTFISREAILHVTAEMLMWLDRYLKGA